MKILSYLYSHDDINRNLADHSCGVGFLETSSDARHQGIRSGAVGHPLAGHALLVRHDFPHRFSAEQSQVRRHPILSRAHSHLGLCRHRRQNKQVQKNDPKHFVLFSWPEKDEAKAIIGGSKDVFLQIKQSGADLWEEDEHICGGLSARKVHQPTIPAGHHFRSDAHRGRHQCFVAHLRAA